MSNATSSHRPSADDVTCRVSAGRIAVGAVLVWANHQTRVTELARVVDPFGEASVYATLAHVRYPLSTSRIRVDTRAGSTYRARVNRATGQLVGVDPRHATVADYARPEPLTTESNGLRYVNDAAVRRWEVTATTPADGRTRDGYGSRIPVDALVTLSDGRTRRVRAMAYGNSASLYVTIGGKLAHLTTELDHAPRDVGRYVVTREAGRFGGHELAFHAIS